MFVWLSTYSKLSLNAFATSLRDAGGVFQVSGSDLSRRKSDRFEADGIGRNGRPAAGHQVANQRNCKRIGVTSNQGKLGTLIVNIDHDLGRCNTLGVLAPTKLQNGQRQHEG